jgi:NAD(P)-dependent dehydrogenase (short-subunit alcohol dehydrogenase family)
LGSDPVGLARAGGTGVAVDRWGVLMNLADLRQFVERPLATLSGVMNTPNSAGRYRPFYLRNVVDAVRGATLDDAVDGKIVLITGGSSGIGAAAAEKIAGAGGEVALVARTTERLDLVADEIRAAGGTAHVYPCDLSDMDAIAGLADQVLAELGRVDILINNAGRSIRRSLELSYDRIHDYQRTMQLNYLGAVQLILKFVPGMRQRGFGQVVNVSSAGVQTRAPRFGAYIASKAALETLCDSLQAETFADGVRFTTVHMALVRTPMISPTKLYDRFPALTPEQAAGVLADAILHQPRYVSPPFGQFAAFADAVNPTLMDRVRRRAFILFDDSTAARGNEQNQESDQRPTSFDGPRETFIRATRGIHW